MAKQYSIEEIRERSADVGTRHRSAVRALTALALAGKGDPGKILKTTWPRDPNAEMILRSVVSPTDTSGFPKWTTASALPDLAPRSAALRLFRDCLQLNLAGKFSIKVPGLQSQPTPIFIAEGGAMPISQLTFGSTEVGPVKKILIGTAVTNELQSAVPTTASAVIGRVLERAVEKSLDAIVFDANAATTVRPAGLLNGVTPLTASAATNGLVAIADDIGSLAAAIAAANIDPSDMILICAVKQATALKTLTGPNFDYSILSTPLLAAGTVVGVAPSAIAYATDGAAPQIETSESAIEHMEDTSPQPITGGTPSPAVPVRSLFQTNSIAIRIRAALTWATIAPGAVQTITGTNW
jgi:hypothetical protein